MTIPENRVSNPSKHTATVHFFGFFGLSKAKNRQNEKTQIGQIPKTRVFEHPLKSNPQKTV